MKIIVEMENSGVVHMLSSQKTEDLVNFEHPKPGRSRMGSGLRLIKLDSNVFST
jgi:hypothetical protein